jgi:hypothetical protein
MDRVVHHSAPLGAVQSGPKGRRRRRGRGVAFAKYKNLATYVARRGRNRPQERSGPGYGELGAPAEFATDSPLEGTRFEPSVSHQKGNALFELPRRIRQFPFREQNHFLGDRNRRSLSAMPTEYL